jgi:hypothetical protein
VVGSGNEPPTAVCNLTLTLHPVRNRANLHLARDFQCEPSLSKSPAVCRTLGLISRQPISRYSLRFPTSAEPAIAGANGTYF